MVNIATVIITAFQHSKQNRRTQLGILIDPDKSEENDIRNLCRMANDGGVDYFLFGGSHLVSDRFEALLQLLKQETNIPLVLFPGSPVQISSTADAILLLSLISGRNADLLIGQHVLAAPKLKASGLEILPTGYMLIDGGKPTTVSYISNTFPIPADKPDIAASTALAGEQLGLKLIYLDAGSGALHHVPAEIVTAVSNTVEIPLIVGGGIRTPEKAAALAQAGANLIVVGNATEKDPGLLREMVKAF